MVSPTWLLEVRWRLRCGILHWGSDEGWIGAITIKRGHEFNEEVAEEFRKLGFQARASVQMTEFNVPSEMGDLETLTCSLGMAQIQLISWSVKSFVLR